jgi:ATP-dependent Zn protease
LDEIVRNKDIFDDGGSRLEELAGYGQAKDWGMNLAIDLAAYKRGELDWSCIEKGLLLDGPPGVGKTQFAKALARSAGVPLIATSVADWNAASYLSGTLQAMRNAFAQARRLAPAVLFIDEIDGISDRSRLQGDYVEYWSQIVNLLLELLAGIDDRPGVVVIGATNHADKIDPAIRRAGRLDRTITIERPDTEDLCKIFRFHLKEDLANADLMPLAIAARGSTGADVEAWVRRARSNARRGSHLMTDKDILQEVKGQQSALPHNVRNIVAIHEAGHIVVGAALSCYEAKRAWITDAGGLTLGEIRTDSHLTLHGLESVIAMLLGGRAAEKLMLGKEEVTIGAGLGNQSDLCRATEIACDIETRYGIGQSGLVWMPDSSRALMLHDKATLASIKNRLERCHQKAESIVQLHCAAIFEIATVLRDNGYVERSELLQIFKEHNLEN